MNNNLITLLHKLPEFVTRRSPLKGGRCSFVMLKQKMSNYFVQNLTCSFYLYQNRTNDAS